MAIVSKRDQSHDAASAKYAEVVGLSWQLYTSNWAVYEAISHIRERFKGGGPDAARYLWDLVSSSSLVRVLEVTPEIESRALQLFWSRSDKAWSVTTCANLVLIEEQRLTRVLSSNQHYRQAGLTCLY